MKKVMIGILILIPILILLIVVAVTNLLQIAAWIAVDDIAVLDKVTNQEAESITVIFPSKNNTHSFYDYVKVKVFPDYANNYSIEWRISGKVECMDAAYKKEYDKYLAQLKTYDLYLAEMKKLDKRISAIEAETVAERNDLEIAKLAIDNDKSLTYEQVRQRKAELQAAFDVRQAARDTEIAELREQRKQTPPEVKKVKEPAMLVDDKGNEVTSNTTGKFVINTYCKFTVTVQVEDITRTLVVTAEGYNVESITLVNVGGDDNTLRVGEKMRVDAKYSPMSSIVSETRWHSTEPSVASVDENGVITAHSVGTAYITVEADRFESKKKEFVTSAKYTVNVVEGVSKFGEEFSTSKNVFSLTDIGLSASDIDAAACDGCAIAGETVNITSPSVAHITKKNSEIITINVCDEDDIVIENADIYSTTNGYVFAVSELTLKLKAVWADVLKEGIPQNVTWSAASDGNVVSVANGVVSAKGSGYAEISAKYNNSVAKVLLNVQVKLVSVSLRTSTESLKVGIARETVFAAEKYKYANVKANNEKEANSVLIQIIGAPKKADNESQSEYAAKLRLFYDAYIYEVTDGSEYAHFSQNSNEPNRLIFNPSALEGKGKQTLTVKVSAKYPRYEGEENFTTAKVEIKVIYGVEVSNIAELRRASEDQKEYAHKDGNLMPRTVGWEHLNEARGRHDLYRYYNSEYSVSTYAICFTSDIAFEFTGYKELNIDGAKKSVPVPQIGDDFESEPTWVYHTDYDDNIRVYGDIYGNGYKLTAEKDQVNKWASMVVVVWNNVTVSNLDIRANKLEKDGNLSADETSGMRGECILVCSAEKYEQTRITGVRIEYCILENGRRAGQSYNADVTFDGLVIRNVDNTAFYIPAKMYPFKEGAEYVTYPMFSHINFNNCVFSNCIGSVGSYAYEMFTVMSKSGSGDPWNPYKDCDSAGVGRFVRNDLAANAEYFKKYFMSAGVNTQIRQTGFLDIYNWQNVENANLIDTGDKSTNGMIGAVANGILKEHPMFKNYLYSIPEKNAYYFHMGFISTGITFARGIFNEPIYLDITFEDSRFGAPINTKGMPSASRDPATQLAESFMQKSEIRFYAYKKNADITPLSSFEINTAFIQHLHGEKSSG